MLKVWGRRSSFNVQKVLWLILVADDSSAERPPLPAVRAWYERLQQRPAYREHVMIPFKDLKGRLEY